VRKRLKASGGRKPTEEEKSTGILSGLTPAARRLTFAVRATSPLIVTHLSCSVLHPRPVEVYT
jgi:hypothetical protein